MMAAGAHAYVPKGDSTDRVVHEVHVSRRGTRRAHRGDWGGDHVGHDLAR